MSTICVLFFFLEVLQLCLDKKDKQLSQKLLYLKDNDFLQ